MMKTVLYIEDDIVDQMAFKRMMKEHVDECTCTIVSSISDFKKLENKLDFDMVITDYYLGDGGADDVINELPNKKIIIVSGSINERLTNTDKIKYLSKPFDYAQINDAFNWVKEEKKMAEKNGTHTCIDLTYLKQLGKGDTDFMNEMLHVATEELKQNLLDFHQCLESRDYSGLKFHPHRFKSRSRILGLGLEEKVDWIEMNCNEKHHQKIAELIVEIIFQSQSALIEMDTVKNELLN